MAALKELDVLEELFAENSHKVGLNNLSTMLGKPENELAVALKLNDAELELIDPEHKVLQKWLTIFNLVFSLISETEPKLDKPKAFLKLKRWLYLPAIHLGNKPPIEFMMKGKTKKVINLLEQLTA